MTEADRKVIRLALGEGYHMSANKGHAKLFLQTIAIIDADKTDHATIAGCQAEIDRQFQEIAMLIEERDAAHEDCRLMQDRLQRLIDAKPTVPMAFLNEIMCHWNTLHDDFPVAAKMIAAKYGCGVTE